MGIGPVEYMVVAFPGNQFKGEILPAIAEQVEKGTIRIIDLAFVSKDADGNVTALEVSDLDSEIGQALHALLGDEKGGLLNDEDIMAVAEEMEPNFSAGLLVWEDVWATKIKNAIIDAGGELWDLERVPYRGRRRGDRVGRRRTSSTSERKEAHDAQRSRIGGDGRPHGGGCRHGDGRVGSVGAPPGAKYADQDAQYTQQQTAAAMQGVDQAAAAPAADGPVRADREARRSCTNRAR